MKRTLLLLPAIACLSLSVFAQVPVDKTVSLQSVEIQGKRFGGLTGGEVKRLQVDSTGISHEDLPIIMEQNRIELNKLLAPYEAVSALRCE